MNISVNRTTVPVEGMFPMLTDFPIYENPDPKVAVLMRLFTQGNWAPLAQSFIPMILWSMRSLIVNSDAKVYKPTPIFHCDQRLWDMGKEVFQEAGVPEDYVIVYDPDIVPTSLDNAIMHLAAAPLLDRQLERFERVIVLDGDLFALANQNTGLLPVMDISLNTMPDNDISLLRSWTVWDPTRDEYKNWYDHGQRDKEGFLKQSAKYCNSTPEIIENIMYPDDLKSNPRPFHNGAYINIPMGWLRENFEFREFVREASGIMGNEEIAFAVWGMKRYLENGIRWPENNLQDFSLDTELFRLSWDLDESWEAFNAGHPVWTHFYSYDNLLSYATQWAKAIGASDTEAEAFHAIIDEKVCSYREDVNTQSVPQCCDDVPVENERHTMFDFQPFPLHADEKIRHVCNDVLAVCESVAKENRGKAYDGSWVVQHSVEELQALYEIAAGGHDADERDGHVVQCGILCGGSALIMAQAIKDTKREAPVLAIDSYTKFWKPLRREFNWAYQEWRENRHEFRMDEHLTGVISTTQSFFKHFWSQPIRVVFIDSSHLYDETVEELSLTTPHIVEGGWLIIHDYFSEGTPGVGRAVDEWLESTDTSEFLFYRIEGLAIIQLNMRSRHDAALPDSTTRGASEPTFDRFAQSRRGRSAPIYTGKEP